MSTSVSIEGNNPECWALASLLLQRQISVNVVETDEGDGDTGPGWTRPLDPRLVEELHLAYYGYHHLAFDPLVSVPFSDGRLLQLWRDPQRTAAALQPFSESDARRYPVFLECLKHPRSRRRALLRSRSTLREVLDYWFDWEPLKATLALVVLAESPGMNLDDPDSSRCVFRLLSNTGLANTNLSQLLRQVYKDLDGPTRDQDGEGQTQVFPAPKSQPPYSRFSLEALPLLDALEGIDQSSIFTGRLGLIESLADLESPGRSLLAALPNFILSHGLIQLDVLQVGAYTESSGEIENRLTEPISRFPHLFTEHRMEPGRHPAPPQGGATTYYLVDPWTAAEHLTRELLPAPRRSWALPLGLALGLVTLLGLRKKRGD